MMDSIKDCFMVALKKNGFSSNSLDESELQIATEDLIAQKPLVQAYVVDQVRDKMIGGEAAMGVMFSGDALYVMSENEDLDFVIPEEGTNVWIDGWVIPKNAPNKENAEKFIDFMCHPDVALKNFEYITYGTPNTAARELIEDEDLKNSPIAFPDLTQYNNLETFLYLGEDGEELYNKYWKEVMSNKPLNCQDSSGAFLLPIFSGILLTSTGLASSVISPGKCRIIHRCEIREIRSGRSAVSVSTASLVFQTTCAAGIRAATGTTASAGVIGIPTGIVVSAGAAIAVSYTATAVATGISTTK